MNNKKVNQQIEILVKLIGLKCRGRIEIETKGFNVVEFSSDSNGKWNNTRWHSKASDDVFSEWKEFKNPDSKKIKLIKEILAD